MKIGFVTGEYPPMEGGVGAFTLELAKAMAARRHEIIVITDRSARPGGVSGKLKDIFEPVEVDYGRVFARCRRWNLSENNAIASAAERYDLDLINIQYQAAAFNMRNPAINYLPFRLRGLVKTVVTYHDLRVPYLFPKAGGLREKAVFKMGDWADGIITTNHGDTNRLDGKVKTPTWQIPIGSNIDVHAVSAETIQKTRSQLGLTPDDRLLGYFGFLNASKGAETLIQCLGQLPPNVHLVFIGGQTGASDPSNNENYLGQIKQLVADNGLTDRVHWTGFVDDEQVCAFLNSAELMVMPYRDGVSLRRGTLMAVLANGRPLLTTEPQAPTPELSHSQNCWLIPPKDTTAMRDAIHHLLADPALLQKLGDGAAQVAHQFGWEHIAERTEAVFAGLLGG